MMALVNVASYFRRQFFVVPQEVAIEPGCVSARK
jgi:hypothetical protein